MSIYQYISFINIFLSVFMYLHYGEFKDWSKENN